MATTVDTVYAAEEVVNTGYHLGNSDHRIHEPHINIGTPCEESSGHLDRRIHVMVCFEDPDTAVGQCVAMLAQAIAKIETPVHIFSRREFALDTPGIYMHALGGDASDTLFSQVQEFTRLASNEFMREFHDNAQVTLMGFEWSSIPTMSLLRSIKNTGFILSLHSMERQRSNLTDGMSRYIEETELTGLREARMVLCHNDETADVVRRCVPECAERIEVMDPMSLIRDFQFNLDPGDVKKRFNVGPVDPTILFIGDLSEDYGADLLMKAIPKILRKHNQARCIFVGDGELLWPLRIQSRYWLLDYAVRLAGHLDGQALRELIYASDIVVVPSRKSTPWWPIEAAWAANRPVVVTSDTATSLVTADADAAVVGPDDSGLAAGIDRVLSDPDFARSIAAGGHQKLEERYSINKVIARIEEVAAAAQVREREMADVNV